MSTKYKFWYDHNCADWYIYPVDKEVEAYEWFNNEYGNEESESWMNGHYPSFLIYVDRQTTMDVEFELPEHINVVK